jgi:methionine-rich copper-binding protein CopC
MVLNVFPRFVRASRAAGLLAVVSAISFLAQVGQAGPSIVSEVPAEGASGVSPSANVVFTFSTAMDTTLTTATFTDTNGNTLTTTPSWSTDGKTLTCTPTPAFPSPDFILWTVTGQDTTGDALPTSYGYFTIGGSPGGGGGGCTPVGNTNTGFVLEESWLFVQTNAGPPVPAPIVAYAIDADVSTVIGLSNYTGNGQSFLTNDAYTDASELNAAWPNGSYKFAVTGTSPALPVVTVDFNLTQPNAPEIANFAASQAVNPTLPFTLSWNSFSNRVDTNEIFVNIGYNSCAGTGFYTNLPGTATSATIPAGALSPGSNYLNSELGFINISGISNHSPEYTAGSVRSSVTSFTLTTTGGSGSGTLSFSNAVLSGGLLKFDITGPADTTITVQYTSNLATGTWATLIATNSGSSGTISVTDTPSKTGPGRFYRAHE